MPQETPYVIDVEAGTCAFCKCGKSQKMPYCDGSHSGSGIVPHVETFDEARKVAVCGCGRSAASPYRDGAHKS
ncbi:MAG: CDGSH iron-sulfur domain-containing protein [Planctomycetota bacterium]